MVHDQTRVDSPNQPILKSYCPKRYAGETASRDFNPKLFEKYPWCSFNPVSKAVECFPCQRFSDNLFSFSNWRNPLKLKKHSQSAVHQLAMTKWINFKLNDKKQSSIMTQLISSHQSAITKNREYLKVIIETLIFCAQQNIPLRGVNEDCSDIGSQSDTNRGNFLELIHLRSRDIPWLSFKLDQQRQIHAQWLSPEIQNELLGITADFIRQAIVKDVQEAKFYSIIVDETTDVSNQEQVSLCLRYMRNGKAVETFFGFQTTKSTDGKTLFLLIKEVLENAGFSFSGIVGQCFDGAANMSGAKKGVAARVKEVVPNAIYVHCYAHLLNLALHDTLENNTTMKNALGVIQSLHNFFNTPKRENVLKNCDGKEFGQYIKLKSLSPTRWTCRWESVKAVNQNLLRIVRALEHFAKEKDAKTCVDAKGLLFSVLDFKFVIALQILKVILSNTNALSAYLQGKIDVVMAKSTANATVETLANCRDEDTFALIWTRSKQICKELDKATSEYQCLFGTRQRQTRPSRRLQALIGGEEDEVIMPGQALSRVKIFFDAMDRVISEMNVRFEGKDSDLLVALTNTVLKSEGPSDDELKLVSTEFSFDSELLQAEAKIYHSQAPTNKATQNPANTVIHLSENSIDSALPHFSRAAKILATIPATSCTAERSFSCLQRVKTYIRCTMGQVRLSSLALINLERSFSNHVDLEKIVDTFANRSGREKHFF